jgi:L-fuculose-phosphate aldolase
VGDKKTFIINEIVKYSQRLDQKGFGANHDGNISALFENTILATPTAVSKGNVVADIIITLDQDGKKISGNGKSFSEIKMHLAAYKKRGDIRAVVHAHPPYATARGLARLPLIPSLPEAIVSLGDVIPVADFAMPGTSENDAIISKMVANYDAFMIAGNGVLAVGDSVEQAYLRLELVEHLVKIHFLAEKFGSPMILSPEDINSLMEKRKAAGLGPKTLSPKTENENIKKPSLDELTKIITEEISNAIKE